MLADQVKRSVSFEIKDKFLDEWDGIKTASYVTDKYDKYENVRGNVRKMDKKIWNKKLYGSDRNVQDNTRSTGERAVKY